MRHTGHTVDIPLVAVGAEAADRDIAVRRAPTDTHGGAQRERVKDRAIRHAELIQGFLSECHRLKRCLHDVLRAEQSYVFLTLDKSSRELCTTGLHDRFRQLVRRFLPISFCRMNTAVQAHARQRPHDCQRQPIPFSFVHHLNDSFTSLLHDSLKTTRTNVHFMDIVRTLT